MSRIPRISGQRASRRLAFVALWLLGSFAGPAYGESPEFYDALLEEAFGAIEADYRLDWAYTESLTSSKGTSVGRFDPSLPEGARWSLMSVDGRKPKAKEVSRYLKAKAKEEAIPQDEESSGPESVAESNSLELIEETSEYWLLSFVPAGEDESGDFMKYLDGRLKINKTGPYLEYLEIRSKGPFKPKFAVKVKKIFTRLEFAPVGENGVYLPQAVDFDIDVRAIGVLKMREKVSMRYSDYEYVGE